MKKEEKLQIINNAVEEYKNTERSMTDISKEYGISQQTLKKHLINKGIDPKPRKGKPINMNSAILELNVSTVEEVSNKYGICKEVLEASKTLAKSKLKQLQIDLAIKEYIETDGFHRSINNISDKYGINRKTLTKYLQERGIEITKKHDFANCNEEAFDVIDTEEKAYWLGFMYADGFICKNTFCVGLSLSIKDIDHVKKFTKFLKFEGGMNIVDSHQFGSKEKYGVNGNLLQVCSTQITNEHLWNGLNSKGCVPNKSLILKFPDEEIFKSKDLIRHFIRGYFDGDGTLGKYQHSKTNKTLEESLMFVGTESFLMDILKYLGNGFLMHKSNCGPNTFRLGYSTSKAIKAAEIMYKDATVYLKRKYDIYINDFASSNRAKTVNPEMGIPC